MFPELLQKYYKIIIILIIIIYLLFIKKTNINISLKLLVILPSSIFLLYFLIKILSLYENFTSPNTNVNDNVDNLFSDINVKIVDNRSSHSINRASAGFKKKSTTAINKYDRIMKSAYNETGNSLKQRGTKRGDELNQTDDDKEGDTKDVKPVSKLTIRDRVIKSSKMLYGDITNDISKEATSLKKNDRRGTVDENILTKLHGRQKTLGKKSSNFTIKKIDDEYEENDKEEYDGIKNKFSTNNIVVLQNEVKLVE